MKTQDALIGFGVAAVIIWLLSENKNGNFLTKEASLFTQDNSSDGSDTSSATQEDITEIEFIP